MSTTIETTQMRETIENLTAAIEQAIGRRGQWMLPAVVIHITDGDGPISYGGNDEFDAIPQPFLTDISWCGRGREFHVLAEFDGAALDELATLEESDLMDYARQLLDDHHCDEA